MEEARSGNYVLFEDGLWEKTLEPKYEVLFPGPFDCRVKPFITIALDGNPDAAFNAYQLDAAIAYAMRKHNTRINDRKNNLVTKKELLRYNWGIEVLDPAFVTEYSNCLDNDYLTSLVIQNNKLTPLGEACMESQQLEMVVEDGCYIARYKVDFFD